jgi:hypothetical protein
MDSTPAHEEHLPVREQPTPHRPREQYIREAMHRLDDHGTHRFAVPVVTPRSESPPEEDGDW